MEHTGRKAPRYSDDHVVPFGTALVRGPSMEPSLRDGDRLLVAYGRTPVEGSVLVARFPDGAIVVKRAADRRTTYSGRPAWWLLSDNPDAPNAMDSRHRGPVADADVIGVVVARLWPRPRLLRPSLDEGSR
ncbi:peptidase S24 [Nocardioides sp. KC13]|uniref:Peptidase S24 n=1 Tax=Nocardioides turkmenicus TaxID=2711220 RepID=A0A6M1QQW6_9ACTN|nr:S24/S26 family peptidase [Nocardioides sp. KC13]NGN92123.1 peptidase S24 [Nocardioides sp. KC13]